MNIYQKFRQVAGKVAAGVSLAVVSATSAIAAAVPIDTAEAVAQLAEINDAVAAVGGALLVAASIAVGFKWLKAAIFG